MKRESKFSRVDAGDFHLTAEQQELKAAWEAGSGPRRPKAATSAQPNVDGRFTWLVERARTSPYPVLFEAIAKLEAVGKHHTCGGPRNEKPRNGSLWLHEIADQTGDLVLKEAAVLLEDLHLNGRDWQKHDRLLKRAFWGDSDGDAFREHFEFEKRRIRKKAEFGAEDGRFHKKAVREGCTDRLAIARVVAQVGVKAASFSAAIKVGYSMRKGTEQVEEPSTGWKLIQVPADRRVRDPDNSYRTLAPGRIHKVRNTLYWHRLVANNDVLLIDSIRDTTIPKT